MLRQQPTVIEGESKEKYQASLKDHMQGERPLETRSGDDNKVRKETEKHARVDEPTIPIPYP